jgi:hypothetical protein
MKRIFTLLTTLLITATAFAQYGQTVTVSFSNKNGKGNKDFQLVIDGRSYSTGASNQSYGRERDDRRYDRDDDRYDRDKRHNHHDARDNDEVVINDLHPGQHTLQVYRSTGKRNSNQRPVYNSSFLVKQGYDLDITIRPNGQVQFTEKANSRDRNFGRGNNGRNNNGGYNNGGYNNGGSGNYPNQQYRSPMADAEFTQLLQSVKSKWFQSGKITAIQDAFNNSSYYFSTYQVRQLLEIITAENSRLDLSKLGYGKVVDPSNYRQLYDLLASQSSRDDLDNYIRNYRY